jgi:hypothetical protein
VKFADEDEYILTRAITKYCHPAISYTYQKIAVTDERDVLALSIGPSPDRPHYVVDDPAQPAGKAYVRVKDRSVQASREVREVLKGERKGRSVRFGYGEKEKQLMQYLGRPSVRDRGPVCDPGRHSAANWPPGRWCCSCWPAYSKSTPTKPKTAFPGRPGGLDGRHDTHQTR